MHDMLIIYIVAKKTPGKRRNLKYIQVHNYATVFRECIRTMLKITRYFLKSNIISWKYDQCDNPRHR